MNIENNYDLTKLNTFGIRAKAKFFVEIYSEEDAKKLFSTKEFQSNDKLFMGGGSNILFTQDYPGIVVLNKIKGIYIEKEDDEFVWIKSMSGEVWHDLVIFTVDKGLWGIENLSLVPGTVGGAPMQNIGAYGVELKETLESVEVIEINTGEKKVFYNEKCSFGYRDSIFKSEAKGKYFILSITLKLSKISKPNLSYKVLKDYLEKNNITSLTPKNISDAVSAIRRSKLPDPKITGNAGSFFKNVFIDEEKLEELKNVYPEIPSFKEDGIIKIPSGWLIEQCGPANGTSWKGYRVGNVGVHDKQALVLVNHRGAEGKEIADLAKAIIDSVYNKFKLKLTPEVNIV